VTSSERPRSQPTQVFSGLGETTPPDPVEGPAGAGTPDAPEAPDPLVGTLLLGKWRVLQRLGAGAFGTVYKVEDLKGGWIEALKVLGVDRMTGADAEGMRKRFLREAQIMKRLGTQSQHIVGLSTYDEDLEAGLIYFTMEYVQGKHLADVLVEGGPWSVARTMKLALQTCDALMAAHEGPEPVVHRDLKLENLMLTKDRTGGDFVKVLDFGIAKIAEREQDSRLTQAGTLGTPGYAAPEQLRAGDVDGRTDLFAFGVILYALLTGRDPWLGLPAGQPTSQTYELMLATDRASVRPMDGTGVDVPPSMEGIVLRLLRRAPEERFQSARELKAALERLQGGGKAAAEATLRVLTAEPGVEVVVRWGVQVVAKGPTPLTVEGLDAGSYRVTIKDPRYESVESPVTMQAGAMRDVTLLATPRRVGMGGGLARRPAAIAAAAVVVLVAAGLVLLRPWGRTVDAAELGELARAGRVASARLAEDGIEGRLGGGPLPAVPFRAPLEEAAVAQTIVEMRAAGVDVDASREVGRLIARAATAQSSAHYYGYDGDDVRGYAERAAALDPESAEARSLLKKVAERLSWDTEAALSAGDTERARELAQQCLTIVPDHPRCLASQGGA
jgi:hypothetical protein